MASVSIASLEEGKQNGGKQKNNNESEGVRTVQIMVDPPDGGYGWVVVLASFMCNLTVDGIAYTFGLFLPELVTSFGSTKSVITWAGSLLSGFYLSAGPVVSALTNKFGCRKVCIAGSLLACFSLTVSTMVTSVPLLLLFYGVLAGTGFSLIYLPAIISVNQYFSQKRATATGVAVCGSGLGAFVFAPLVQYLLEVFAWRGALLILAGLALNCCVFGSLMRPLEIWTNAEKPLLQRIWEEKTGLMRQESISQSQFFLVQHADGTVERRLKAGINTEPGVHSTLFLDQWGKGNQDTPLLTLSPIEEQDPNQPKPNNSFQPPSSNNPLVSTNAIQAIAKRKGLIASHSAAKLSMSASTVTTEIRRNSSTPKFVMGASRNSRYGLNAMASSNVNNHEAVPLAPVDGAPLPPQMRKSIKDLARPMYRKDIFYSGSVRNLPEFRQSSGDVRSYIASVLTIPGENQQKPVSSLCSCLPTSMSDTLGDIFDPVLLKNPAFIIICVANLVGMMGFNIPFVFIADAAVTMANVDKESAAFLVSCIGITNMLGRLLFGRISDSPRVNSLAINNITLVISGVAVAIMPLSLTVGGYTATVVVSAIFGLIVAAYILLTSIIIVDLFGLEHLTNAFGLLCLVRGMACILGIPFAGMLYDVTGSYHCPFIVSGIMLAVSGGISATIPYVSNPHKVVPPRPEEFMSPLEEIPEEESFTEEDISPEHERRNHFKETEDSLAEDERASFVEILQGFDEEDEPIAIICDPRPEAEAAEDTVSTVTSPPPPPLEDKLLLQR